MDTFVLIIRIILLTLACVLSLVYVLLQFYQKIPLKILNLSTADMVFIGTLTFMFGFGFNSYQALLSFVPLYLLKVLVRLSMKQLRKGFWMEVSWKKLTPKGFEKELPRQTLNEMGKMPKSVDFIIPRFYFSIGTKLLLKNLKKQQQGLPINQQRMFSEKINEILDGFLHLKPYQTKNQSLPFGMIKVHRF